MSRLSKNQLIEENAALRAEITSLQRLVEKYQSQELDAVLISPKPWQTVKLERELTKLLEKVSRENHYYYYLKKKPLTAYSSSNLRHSKSIIVKLLSFDR